MPARWRTIILLWLVGVLAAAEFGKITPLVPILHDRLHLSLTAAGWLTSLLELGGGTCGIVAGLAISRLGAQLALTAGLSLLVVAGGAEALTEILHGPALPLFAGRVVESAGYLMIVIAAPSLIFHACRPEDHAAALGLWATFVPVGIALGAFVSGLAVQAMDVGGALAIWPAIAAVLLVVWLRLKGPAIVPVTLSAQGLVLPGRPIWLLCIGFGAYTILFMGTRKRGQSHFKATTFVPQKYHPTLRPSGAAPLPAARYTV